MEVDAIGQAAQTTQSNTAQVINQEEFIQLFLAQLQFQDPLEPVDNREFMAQLAQFSVVEQVRQNGDQLLNMNFAEAVNQGTNLLGRTVALNHDGSESSGEVTQVNFTAQGPLLRVKLNADDTTLDDVRLSQILFVR